MTKLEFGRFALDSLKDITDAKALRGMEDAGSGHGDIDIVVPPGMAFISAKTVAKRAGSEGLYVIFFRNIGYVCSIGLFNISDDGQVSGVKLDFINGLAWYGVGLNSKVADPFGKAWMSIHGNWCDERIKGAFSYFQKIMASGFVSNKEWTRVKQSGADPKYLAHVSELINFPLSINDIRANKISVWKKWRLRAASGGGRGPRQIFRWFSLVFLEHAKFKANVGNQKGMVIGVSGLDGSGKSTLVERLINAYKVMGVEEPELVHLLPSWIPLPHQLVRRKKTQDNYTRPYSEPPVSSRLSGSLRLAYYIVGFFATRLFLSAQTARGRFILLDRSIIDFGSDPTRSRIPVRKLPNWLMRFLLPKGSHFYLDASPDVVVARKGELSLEKAACLRVAYLDSCSKTRITRLDGNCMPDAVFRTLLLHLSHECQRRIRDAEVGQ